MGLEQQYDETYKILLVAAEAVPFAKTGGLADVVGSLPKALAVYGNDVRVAIPRYRGIEDLTTLGDFPVQVGNRRETAIVRQSYIRAQLDGVERLIPTYLIDNYHYFDRERLHGYGDDAQRWAFFCRAVLEWLRPLSWKPDVIHVHDWHTAPIPVLLKAHYGRDPFYSLMATLLTVHNAQYQGNFGREALDDLGLDASYYSPDQLEFYGKVSYLKAGLLYADLLNTVSRTYTQEVQRDRGFGLEGVFAQRADELFGIQNGINYHEFNPATDPRIYRNYSQANWVTGKRENKHALQKELGLPIAEVPVLAVVSRLVEQKGIDLLLAAADDILQNDVQLAVLGQGEARFEDGWRQLRRRYPERVGVTIGFNSVLAQRIYAGADIFLMPSRFEPSGISQLIAMRYGTVPLVHATGGLADTVMDYDEQQGIGTGFSFDRLDASSLVNTVRRALGVYANPDRWRRVVEADLRADFSWNHSASEYMALYASAVAKVRQRELAAAF